MYEAPIKDLNFVIKNIIDLKKLSEVDDYKEFSDDLVEAVTRIGDHHIDNPCMACLDGHYVINGRKVHELVKE